jgi:hypothetical protein
MKANAECGMRIEGHQRPTPGTDPRGFRIPHSAFRIRP